MSKTKTSKTSTQINFAPVMAAVSKYEKACDAKESARENLATTFAVFHEKIGKGKNITPKAFHAAWVKYAMEVEGKSRSQACRIAKAAGLGQRAAGGGRKARPLHERIIAKVSEVKIRDGESLGKRELAEVMRAIAAQFTA